MVYIKKGVYKESVLVRKENITIYGDGSAETVITGCKNFIDGVRTFKTATFGILIFPPSALLKHTHTHTLTHAQNLKLNKK